MRQFGSGRPEAAHMVLDMDQLLRVARANGRSWVSREEWMEVRARGARWSAEALRQDRRRVALAFRGAGVELRYEEVSVVAPEGRAHVDTPAVCEVLDRETRWARAKVAARTGDSETLRELLEEKRRLSPVTVRLEYWDHGRSFDVLKRKHGIGSGKLRRWLVSRGPLCRRAHPVFEERRPLEILERARERAKAGASLRELCEILECSRRSLSRWLRREGLQVSGVKRDETPTVHLFDSAVEERVAPDVLEKARAMALAGASTTELCAVLGASRWSVIRWLRREGHAVRSRGRPHGSGKVT